MTSASASRRAYVLSGRRPKPDVGNLVKDQAHAPLPASRLDMRACHPAVFRPSVFDGVSTPRLRAFTEGEATIE